MPNNISITVKRDRLRLNKRFAKKVAQVCRFAECRCEDAARITRAPVTGSGATCEWIGSRMPRASLVSSRFVRRSCTISHLSPSSTDPSHPAGKRKEIDNVMKKARQQPANEYWDKKLLEAEEKDPNRWKHTGYKKMVYEGGRVNGARKSRSRSPMVRKTPVSPRSRPHMPQSPVRRRMSRTPERSERYRPRSPPARNAREMKPKEMYRPMKGRPISPPPPKVRKTIDKWVNN